jgi:hypothetical protein
LASIERRIEDLEQRLGGEASESTVEAVRFRRKFVYSALDAYALIYKPNPLTRPPWSYDIQKLHNLGTFEVATYVAALTFLEHEDEAQAREIFAEKADEGSIERVILEKLINLWVAHMWELKLRREESQSETLPRRPVMGGL